MGLNQYLISIALISIFALAFINFGVEFGTENNAPINIGDDPNLASARADSLSDVATFSPEVNESAYAYQQSQISETAQSGSFTSSNIFTNPFSKLISSMKNILNLGYKSIFGGSSSFSWVLSVVLGVMALILVFAGYKLLKGGNPDN